MSRWDDFRPAGETTADNARTKDKKGKLADRGQRLKS